MAPGRQPLRHLRRDPGLPAVAGSFSGRHRERAVDVGLGRLSLLAAYSISEAAALSLTQSLRALVAARGVRVHAVLAGAVDTDMTRGFDRPKASVASVARAIFDGMEHGEEEILPDPRSASMAESWRSGAAKALERQYAALVALASGEA